MSGRETQTEVTVTAYRDGPYLIRGPFRMLDQEGNELALHRRTIALCRCGKSRMRPLCDGTHRATGFRAPSAPETWPHPDVRPASDEAAGAGRTTGEAWGASNVARAAADGGTVRSVNGFQRGELQDRGETAAPADVLDGVCEAERSVTECREQVERVLRTAERVPCGDRRMAQVRSLLTDALGALGA